MVDACHGRPRAALEVASGLESDGDLPVGSSWADAFRPVKISKTATAATIASCMVFLVLIFITATKKGCLQKKAHSVVTACRVAVSTLATRDVFFCPAKVLFVSFIHLR